MRWRLVEPMDVRMPTCADIHFDTPVSLCAFVRWPTPAYLRHLPQMKHVLCRLAGRRVLAPTLLHLSVRLYADIALQVTLVIKKFLTWATAYGHATHVNAHPYT